MAALFSCLIFCVLFVQQPNRVEVEVLLERGGPMGKQQEWLRSLSELNFDDLRMRSQNTGDRVGIRKSDGRAIITYKITCRLTADNRLQTPGGTFRSSELGRFKTWVDGVRAGALEQAAEDTEKMAFGLKPDELVRLHEQLGAKVLTDTRDIPIDDAIRAIRKNSRIQISIHTSASAAMRIEMNVLEDFSQFSCGTALAAIIRPLGLVAVPVRTAGGNVRIQLMDSRVADEYWPIGWPLEVPTQQVAPKLFEFLQVEIDDYAMDAALTAIHQKTSVPFVFDQNAMARHEIEPGNIRVTIPPDRTYYFMVVRKILRHAKPTMKPEIRVDEAGMPFIWVTTYQ